MTKQKKKRSKQYSGVDAKIAKPLITKVSAVHRNKIQQWWIDNKRTAKPIMITGAIAIIVIWLIFELVRIASGSFA